MSSYAHRRVLWHCLNGTRRRMQTACNFVSRVSEDSSSRSKLLAGLAFGVTGAGLAVQHSVTSPIKAEEVASISPMTPYARLSASEIYSFRAERVSSAFVFIKPHAVTDQVKAMVAKRFAAEGFKVISEGAISSEKIDKEMLIDIHYGAIAARAMKQKPAELAVTQKAQDDFQKAFGLSWGEALTQGQVFNLVDGAAKLGCSYSELGDKYDRLKKGVDMIKFGGGFYCGKVDGIYVINGFYARMRGDFTVPGECIYYYQVEWDTARTSWADFRGKLLGGTDPKSAAPSSMRNEIFRNWKSLGLTSEPDTGKNGLHASASPFEALSERANWLGMSLAEDYFGRAMMASGVPVATIKAWCNDPAVSFAGKKQSLFDLLEDLDGRDCIQKSVLIQAQN